LKSEKKLNKKFKDLIFKSLAYGLLAPVVVDKRWNEISENLKILAKGHRMMQSMNCVTARLATEFDALVYLHTASLCVPFNTTWYNIYTYLFRKYFPMHAEVVGIDTDSLNDYEKYQLDQLRAWIFKQQIKAIKEKYKISI